MRQRRFNLRVYVDKVDGAGGGCGDDTKIVEDLRMEVALREELK
jgi:hypothetical protein